MKSIRIYSVLFFVACLAQASFGQNISGSAHDFSDDNWNNSGEICIVCHTPHNANMAVAEAPLWNHQVTTATFQVYSSPTFTATAGQPGASSKLCLSCHDGTVAVENYGNITNGNDILSGGSLIGTDLRNDHPISITYNTALATTDGGLHDPSTANSGLGSTITADLLFAGKMECASCHDVHNGAGFDNLLRKSNAASALCLTCHDK
ncbi:MAG TPA: cytochrome c3 family protein [Draconibacterium sp.]|nr:cytochrome c3 family protein [Draconibacterium sp.]